MMVLMAGALILGSGSSWVMSFAPFFIALLSAVALGAGTALIRGIPFGDLPWPGLILLVTAQLAYGLGLLGQVGLSRLSGLWPRSASVLPNGQRGVRKDKAVDPVQHRLR